MVADGSTALTMSISARPATATQVSASISTPVRSAVRTVAEIATASSSTCSATSTPCTAIGWQSGTRSGVRFAAWMPAIRATASASPLGTPAAAQQRAPPRPRPAPARCAVALRAVTSLPDTSTMRAAPDSSMWVKPLGHDRRRSSTMTSTAPPAGISVTSSGMTTKRVGLGQVAHQVRARPADRLHDVPALLDVDPRAGELPDAPRARSSPPCTPRAPSAGAAARRRASAGSPAARTPRTTRRSSPGCRAA